MTFEKYLNKEKYGIVREILLTIIISSIVSGLVSYYFAQRIDSNTSKREFFSEFSRTFFDNPKYRKVSIALEEQYLYGRGKIFTRNGGKFSDYDIDGYLYFLYDLYSFADENLLTYPLVSDQYAYYVCITYNNPEIQNYHKRLLKEGFSDREAMGTLQDFAEKLGITKDTNCKTL